MTRLLLIWLMSCVCVAAAVKYVRTDGNNANDGTENNAEHAWLTITYGESQLSEGDTLYVDTGAYAERVTVNVPNVMLESGSATVAGFVLAATNVTVSTFLITGTTPGNAGIHIESTSNGCTVTNCILYDLPYAAGGYGVYLEKGTTGPSAVTISRNTFSNVAYVNVCAYGSNTLILLNTFQNATADAIYCFGSDITVRSNIFRDLVDQDTTGTLHVDLIQSFGDNDDDCVNVLFENNYASNIHGQLCNIEPKGRTFTNWVFRNNVFVEVQHTANCYNPFSIWENNTWVRGGVYTNSETDVVSYAHPIQFRFGAKGESTNNVVLNNMFIGFTDRDDIGWYVLDAGASVSADYNYVTKLKASAFAAKTGFVGVEAHGINGGDPCFVSYDNNLRLTSISPAIDAATTLSSLFTTDITGKTRTGDWDIGAYEYGRVLRTTTLRAGNVTGP
jgi:hypothetical protein